MKNCKTVTAVKPAAAYIGGKSRLAKKVIQRIDEIDHKTYVEPFLGMGGIFFRRTKAPSSEVINDLNGEVTNFFRILQRHYQPFAEMLSFTLSSRQEFERYKRIDPATLTDLERALRFLYMQKLAFGGKVAGQNFGVRPVASGRFDPVQLRQRLASLHERLSSVVIECLGYSECIARYDHPRALFYLDPPYWGSEGTYGRALFSREDFEKLADQLSGIKGQFLLSINDKPEIRSIFKAFDQEQVSLHYSVGAHGTTRAAELIISN